MDVLEKIDFKLPLRPYQVEGVGKFVDFPHALFADAMGVGKTVQCIALDLVRREQATIANGNKEPEGGWKTLVVAPLTGVIDQWVTEIGRFTDLRVRRINPKKREWLFKQDADVYVIHPDGLRIMGVEKLVDALPRGQWLHFIFDEIHRIKNRKAKTSKQAVAVGKHFAHRTGATGTPMENRPDELWHLLYWFFPDKASREAVDMKLWFQKVLNSYWRFYNRYVDYYEDDYGYHHITGPRNVPELKELRDPVWIRRLKEDVLKDLPPKQYQRYEVDLTSKQRKAYNAMKDTLIAWIGENENQPVIANIAIAQLIRLQQFALAYGELVQKTVWKRDGSQDILNQVHLSDPSSKLDALEDILDDLGDSQAVVFSTSKQIIKMASERLENPKKLGLTTGMIHGDIPDIKRSGNIKRFQSGETQVLLCTIRAGGVGLNLQNCSTGIFLDRDWSPGVNQQAEDRMHRSGQEADKVHIIDIVARDTIDQRKDRKLERKWQWIKEVVGA